MEATYLYLLLGTKLLNALPFLLLAGAAWWFARSDLGRAVRDRVTGGGQVSGEDVRALMSELQRVREELAVLQERVDFGERLMSDARGRLEDPRHAVGTRRSISPASEPLTRESDGRD